MPHTCPPYVAHTCPGSVEALPTYFVKNGGNDNANGTSEATAWATVAQVNATTLTAGQSVGFKRGDVWREAIVPKWNTGGSAGNNVVFRGYGTGAKPLFKGGLDLSSPAGWEEASANKWRWTTTNALETSMLFMNGATISAYRKTSVANLTAQGDFFYDTGTDYTYLYSTSNPGTFYTNIESSLAHSFGHMGSQSYITVNGLDLRFWGHGVLTSYPSDGHVYEYNDISCIGGYTLATPSGNGPGGQGTSHDIIRYNRIHQIYDAGMSTINTSSAGQLHDNEFYGNVVSNCEYGYEQQSYDTADYNGNNIHGNVFYKCGDTFWHAQRPDPSGYGFQSWNHAVTPTNCQFDDNIVYGSVTHIRKPSSAGWTVDGNRYYADGAAKFVVYSSDNNTFAQWQAHGHDASGSLINEIQGTDAEIIAALEEML